MKAIFDDFSSKISELRLVRLQGLAEFENENIRVIHDKCFFKANLTEFSIIYFQNLR